jgi:hypothetical protein
MHQIDLTFGKVPPLSFSTTNSQDCILVAFGNCSPSAAYDQPTVYNILTENLASLNLE